MSLKDMPKEEIELMSYTDLTYSLLKENKETMKTADIFKSICKLLEYNDDYYVNAIGDYYTSLTLDKRFVLLDNKEWDIRDNRPISIVLDEDEEEIDETDDELLEDEEELPEEDNFEDNTDDDNLDDDDDLGDLAIVDEEELEET